MLRLLLCLGLAACSSGSRAPAGADLSGFEVQRIQVGGVPYEVWVARTPAERQQGLMLATAQQMAPLQDGTERGMLFIFPAEQVAAFWMRDTLIPLDLAYARADATIVQLVALTPLDETLRLSSEPVLYALEVNAGSFAKNGIAPGAVIVLP